jgi:hypothetical protein
MHHIFVRCKSNFYIWRMCKGRSAAGADFDLRQLLSHVKWRVTETGGHDA